MLFRLRSGHYKLNHYISKLEPETQDECPHGCPEKEDATHVVLYCQQYEEARANMEQHLPTLNTPIVLIELRLQELELAELFLPFIFGSQQCETYFKAIRSFTPVWSTQTNIFHCRRSND